MLDSIVVKNLALIREAELECGEGLNILSGETGAGKSILLGSVNLCLGAKADKSLIREGAEYALVELVFHVDSEETRAAIRAMELPVEEDGTVIISRKITENRSLIRVCGETVSVKQVRELASLLIDVHGQHEHQSLLRVSRHRELLDDYCGEAMKKELAECEELFHERKAVRERLEALDLDEGKREREIELAAFEIGEIEGAALKPGEEEELEERYRRMKGARDSFEDLGKVRELLDGDDSVLDALGRAVHELNAAAGKDEGLADDAEALSTAEDMLRGVLRSVSDRLESGSFDPELFAETERRLDEIRRLFLKYGEGEEAVLSYLEKRKAKLGELENLDAAKEKLLQEDRKLGDRQGAICEKLRKRRMKAAKELENEIGKVLGELNFLKADFRVELTERKEPASYGADDAEFMISLNPGEKLRPLKDVASGGELSRIMLALKTVFASRDGIGTLIFDEIDSGISGRTAWKVSEKMGGLSRERQLICITHLPQIAAMADRHFVIEKAEKDGKTQTGIRLLSEAEQTEELARMLGGESSSEAALSNARELREQALECKAQTCVSQGNHI
ncbi:MAG: DNA repair protein RecN [Lachnospiraceae bacterium]|nr:DNA repair protein RecN [Lachnospiraceae bacterium]